MCVLVGPVSSLVKNKKTIKNLKIECDQLILNDSLSWKASSGCGVFLGALMCKTIFFACLVIASLSSVATAGIITFDGRAGEVSPIVVITPLEGTFTFTALGGPPNTSGVTSFANVVGATTDAYFFFAANIITVNYVGAPGATFNLTNLHLGSTVASANPPAFTIGGVAIPGTFSSLTSTAFSGAAFSNLTSLTFVATEDAAFDNFAFTINAAAAVPEPASTAFLGLGSFALVLRRVRRRTSVVA
jgi:hypothetical protein